MAEVYSVLMNKGGIGKTTIVTNLSGAITKTSDNKVLIIDTDGQGNAAMAFGITNPNAIENTLYDVMLEKKTAEEVIIEIEENLHLLPSNSDLNYLELDLLPTIDGSGNHLVMLRKIVEDLRGKYDYIFIDSPPSLSLMAWNILMATDKVIIPFAPETFGTNGLVNVIEAINDFKEREKLNLEIAGVVGMMVQTRTNLHDALMKQARDYCETQDIRMYETFIPKSIQFANATAFDGVPATWTNPQTPLIKSYYKLLEEVLR